MKINKYNDNGFVYYEAVSKNFNLLAFKVKDLIVQLWTIYKIDLRVYLFDGEINNQLN